MAAETAFGAQLWLDDEDGDLTKIANALSVPPPGATAETIDASDHDSGEYAEYIVSPLKRVPTLSITIHRQAGATKDALLFAAVGDTRTFTIVEKKADGTLWGHSGECIVTGYEPDADEVEGKKTGTVMIQPTGAITRATFVAPV